MTNNIISKRALWYYVNRKMNNLIHQYHVFSVLSILLEEMIYDLKEGKSIKIKNFGTFVLRKMSPRKYHDVNLHQMKVSQGNYCMRLFLAPLIRKKLCQSLSLDNKLNEN